MGESSLVFSKNPSKDTIVEMCGFDNIKMTKLASTWICLLIVGYI